MMQGAHSRFDFGTMAEGYDRWYETPGGSIHDGRQKSIVRRVLPPSAVGAALLDVGCGTGHWSRFFSSLGYRVFGVDLSPEMAHQARCNDQTHGPVAVADAGVLPFRSGTFDVVAAVAVIEFVIHLDAVISELVRCVRSNGAILVGTLNRLARLNRDRVTAGKEPYCSACLLSPPELEDLLAPIGTVEMQTTAPDVPGGEDGTFVVAIVHLQPGEAAAGPHGGTG